MTFDSTLDFLAMPSD